MYDAGGEISSGPVIDSHGRVIFGTKEGTLYALDRKGNLMWTFEGGSSITSHPAVSKEGFIFFGCEDGYLYALNPDGSIRWKTSTGGKIVSSPVVSENSVYFGSTDGKFYAVYETTMGLDDGPWPMCCGNENHMKVIKY
jgi:outer membrane protein assembly factor BamB